jgi:cytochrome P450
MPMAHTQISHASLPDELARTVAEPRAYADLDAWHEKLKVVRREHPFARAELPDYKSFWVASKFDDIQAVARQNDVFLSGLGALVPRAMAERVGSEAQGFRSVVGMNPPEHSTYRLLTQAWLAPKNIKRLEDAMRSLARRFVDQMGEASGEIDFAKNVAAHYPLLVIMSILGVPPEDEPMMLRLTQEYFGNSDEELTRRRALTSEEVAASLMETIAEVSDYFRQVTTDRRRQPADDLASVIANARIDGAFLPERDSLGYYITIAFAGHDTTSSSVAGGLWALAERPQELAKAQADPGLIPSLVEESIRWTTPVYQFVRAAAEDAEVRGQIVRAGDQVVLCFPSGNRDEDAFEDPFEFRLDRKASRHVAFGYGPHQCLGMHLARMEMAIFFEELLPRLRSLELAGPPSRTTTNFVGGPKSLPIRYRMA